MIIWVLILASVIVLCLFLVACGVVALLTGRADIARQSARVIELQADKLYWDTDKDREEARRRTALKSTK